MIKYLTAKTNMTKDAMTILFRFQKNEKLKVVISYVANFYTLIVKKYIYFMYNIVICVE